MAKNNGFSQDAANNTELEQEGKWLIIPPTVLGDDALTPGAKMVYGRVFGLMKKHGYCYASNDYLGLHIGLKKNTVKAHLVTLYKKGYLRYELIRAESGEIIERRIYPVLSPEQNPEPEQENNRGGRTSPHPTLEHADIRGRTSPHPKRIEIEKKNLSNSNISKGSRLKTEKGGEGTQASARSHRERMATGKRKEEAETKENTRGSDSIQTKTNGLTPTQKRGGGIETPKQKPTVYVGKPLTQEEIDEKRRNGQNASGFTPLAGIIPASHWQELEARAATNGNGNGNLYYHHTTKNAPLSIDATIEQLSTLLHDEPENTAQNINRAAKLCREAGLDPEQFTSLLWSIYHELKKKPDKLFKTRRADGRANKMPVFFTELEKALGVKPKLLN